MPEKNRIFLCVIDGSIEQQKAMTYAAVRAKEIGGSVMLFSCVEKEKFTQWLGVKDLMEEEAMHEAKEKVEEAQNFLEKEFAISAKTYITVGDTVEELIKLIDDEPIGVLVLASAVKSKSGPGPLISRFITKQSLRIRVPITVIPGFLNVDEILAISKR